jgi:DNA-binding transcriptional MerR regulator
MRIGELARDLGVSADTLRYYERSGFLPSPARSENGYRAYGAPERDRLRLLLDLRRLDIPLEEAARLAGWCQSGHCEDTTAELPQVLAARRRALRARIDGLRELEARLDALERHLQLSELPMAGGPAPCCSAAASVYTTEGESAPDESSVS